MPTALLTGANRGIGLQLATQLRARGVDVIAAGRADSFELSALDVRFEPLDLLDDSSVKALAGRLAGQRIDLLIHNAGVLIGDSLDSVRLDDVRQQLEVNTLGPLKLTAALRSNLGSGSKIAILTSRMGSLADNCSGGAYGYRLSKAGVNAVGRSLAVDLAPEGIAVLLVHPGWVRTAMTGNSGLVDADEAAAGVLKRIDELTVETTGRFLHANGEVLPW
jgi:NAD(P)-dependent dehydrogenase (short-subunit alcohol dehydrogenase family)